MPGHTPLPWVVPAQLDPQAVEIDAPMGDTELGHVRWNGFIVCYGCDDDPGNGARKARANAEFVVLAATYHARLVEALRGFVEWADAQEWRRPGKALGRQVAQARALLAQLDGESE